MAGGSSSSLHPEGPDVNLRLDKNKLAIGVELLVGLLQISVGLLGLTSQTKILLFVLLMLTGLVVLVLWSGAKSHAPAAPSRSTNQTLIALLLGGTLIGIAVIAAPTLIEKWESWNPIVSPTDAAVQRVYFMRVHVYRDDGHTGDQEGTDPSLADIPITIRDEFGGNYPLHRTDAHGDIMIHLPHYGEISVGICHVFQTHHLGPESDKHPSVIEVGIDPAQVETCRA